MIESITEDAAVRIKGRYQVKMRQMEFKMERPGLVEPGQIDNVTEGVVAAYFYYTIEPAVAMSANYRSWQRLKSSHGKVIDVKQTPQGYYVVCEFDEEEVE